LALAGRVFLEENEQERARALRDLESTTQEMDRRYEDLLGDDGAGGGLLRDPALRAGVRERRKHWEKIKADMRDMARKPAREQTRAELLALGNALDDLAAEIDKGVNDLQRAAEAKIARFQYLQ